MKNTPIIYYLLFLSLFIFAVCFHNPGIILQLPINYTLPQIHPNLPQSIPSILLQKLQLTDIYVRQVNYKWRYDNKKFVILLERSLISFIWKYGHDEGVGTFNQQYTDLIIDCSYGIDSDFRFKVDIEGAKITNQDKRHKIKISLGGGVPETLAVQVTNLILNHAKAAFRFAIKDVISKIVESFTEPLRKDFKVVCVQVSSKQHCIYINTTLVAKPFQSENVQLIQINGAPYIDKNSSGFVEPSQVMFKVNSTNMNIQVSKQFVNKLITFYMKLQPLDKTIKTTEISSVADIDSQTLTVVFPGMNDYVDPRPVLLGVHVASVQTDLTNPPLIGIIAKCSIKVQTQYRTILPYIDIVNGTVSAKLQPIINGHEIGVSLNEIQISNLEFDSKDVKQERVNPPQLIKHLQTLMTWTVQGANGALNQKKQDLQFLGVKIQPKLYVLKASVNVELKFVYPTLSQNVKYQIEEIL